MATADSQPRDTAASTRPPAVAGQFYPASPTALRADIQRYLAQPTPLKIAPAMLIVPHAGYVFSAPVAAKGYAAIDKSTRTVIIVGPSHHAAFEGIAVSGFEAWRTPLGTVPLDKAIIAELKKDPKVKVVPNADVPEHSLEVQVPFLQALLPSFSLVPIQTGSVDPAYVAKLLLPYVVKGTLVIASTDLSHYNNNAEAQKLDKKTIATVLSGDPRGFLEACGDRPIQVVMHLAKALGLKAVLVDARNSFQTAPQFCSDDRVVGYATIAYTGPLPDAKPKAGETAAPSPAAGASAEPADLPPEVKGFLLRLARRSLEAWVRNQRPSEPADVPAVARANSGCFVTLTKNGNLRGCIGNIEPIRPLYKAVIENARSAALSDPRFPPVTPDELTQIKVEVSVLTEPRPLPYSSPDELLRALVPGRDGIVLEKGFSKSTFLPQVWDQIPDKVEFLEHLSVKGGMSRDGWKTATVKRYFAIHFEEE